MLEHINDDTIYTALEVELEYKNCKVLMKDIDISRMPIVTGKVCAISRNRESLQELRQLARKLKANGSNTVILGNYDEGEFKYE